MRALSLSILAQFAALATAARRPDNRRTFSRFGHFRTKKSPQPLCIWIFLRPASELGTDELALTHSPSRCPPVRPRPPPRPTQNRPSTAPEPRKNLSRTFQQTWYWCLTLGMRGHSFGMSRSLYVHFDVKYNNVLNPIIISEALKLFPHLKHVQHLTNFISSTPPSLPHTHRHISSLPPPTSTTTTPLPPTPFQ